MTDMTTPDHDAIRTLPLRTVRQLAGDPRSAFTDDELLDELARRARQAAEIANEIGGAALAVIDERDALLDENERLRSALRRVIAASDETCACCDCRNCRAYNDVMDDVSRSLVVPVSARSGVES